MLEALDEMLGQRLPAEEVAGVILREGAQALVRVARLDGSCKCWIERPLEGEVARDVLALGPDGDHLHRLLQTLDTHCAALDVVEALDLAREVRHARAHEHLAGPREGAEPSREVERAAAIAAVDRHRLARIEADPDGERQAGIGDRLRYEALLQVGGCPQRLASGIEDGERLVAAQLDERAAGCFDRLARELRETRREPRRRLVTALVREPRVPAHVGDQERLDPGFDSRHARIVRLGAR